MQMDSDVRDQDLLSRDPAHRGFISFSYTYTSVEVSAGSGTTRVRSRSTRLDDGKLTSESFEGELPAGACHDLVAQAQQQFVRQAQLMLASFSTFLLPFARRRDRD